MKNNFNRLPQSEVDFSTLEAYLENKNKAAKCAHIHVKKQPTKCPEYIKMCFI
jgi:hypothetical protein